MCLPDYNFLPHWIEKQRSCRGILEHLKSSDTKITTRGSIVCQLCEWRNGETKKDLGDEFMDFFTPQFFWRCRLP